MTDFKVPTVQVPAEILCLDGHVLNGTVFMPALSAVHAGAMLPEEWINSPNAFFPFRMADGDTAMVVNKRQVLAFTVAPPEPAASEEPWDAQVYVRRVIIDAGGRQFEGSVVIDMPENQRRVADYLNRPDAFVLLRSDDRHRLIRKSQISRVVETEEA